MPVLFNVIMVFFFCSLCCNIGQWYHTQNLVQEHVNESVNRGLRWSQGHTSRILSNEINIPAGSRKIFIDLGANDGASTSYFINPLNAKTAGGLATQGGDHGSFLKGMGASGDWEVVIFEANLNYTVRLEALQQTAMAGNMVKNFTVFGGTAISKNSGTVSFILDNAKAGAEGATTVPESTSAVGPHVEIPSVGIVDLFHRLKIHQTDYVILKMDVEGYEFELLRHVITHGLHSRIDILAVEYHDINYWVFGKDDATRIKYQALHKCLDWMMEEIHSMKVVKWG